MQLKNSLLCALGATLIVGTLGFWYQHHKIDAKKIALKEQEESLTQALKAADGLVSRNHPLRALTILQDQEQSLENYPQYGQRFAEIALNAAKELGEERVLQSLYQKWPGLVAQDEELSLRLAARFLLKGDVTSFNNLKETWERNSKDPEQWFLLQADALAIQGEPEEALQLLKSRMFHGEEEKARLLRMALLSEQEHPKVAWEYLTQALKLNPNDGSLHYFRGKMLEDTPHQELAVLEYQQSIQKQPRDPFFKEELANYYINEKQYALAADVLQNAVAQPTNDALWLKALFISRIYKPISFDLAHNSIPEGPNRPLLLYFFALPPQQSWNQALLANHPEVQKLADASTEAKWLAVIGTLQANKDVEAFKYLYEHPEIAVLSPELYNGLQVAIAYKYPHLNLEPNLVTLGISSSTHPFLKQLLSTPYPSEVEKLLASSESYSAVFLAAGWYEAALAMHRMAKIPADFPRWLPFGLTQALAANRNIDEALVYAEKQSPTPQLTLLRGELYLKANKKEDAVKTLSPLAHLQSDLGIKATSLLTQLYMDQGNFTRAKDILSNNTQYADSIAGKEKLAQLELKLGHPDAANAIYASILNQSAVAKSYLATKAYQAKDYTLAYQLTMQLAKEFPYRKDIKAQLTLISEAMKKK